jgi:sulfate adenylyltransferase subunit 1 (EFTu-like GTPase family)
MGNEGDPTSIGSVLVHMGAISESQLWEALSYQLSSDVAQAIGDILVEQNACTKDQVSMAVLAQKGLRSGKQIATAVAVADVAQARKKVQQQASCDVVQKGRELVDRLGYEYTPTPVFGIELALLKR